MKAVILLSAISITFVGLVQGFEAEPNRNIKEAKQQGHLLVNKQRRSIYGRALKVVTMLKKGAVQVETKSQHYLKYIKHGTKDDALQDFLSSQLDGVRRGKTRAQDPTTDGNIGTMLVRLKTSDSTQHNRPSITVQNKENTVNFKIVYYDELPQ